MKTSVTYDRLEDEGRRPESSSRDRYLYSRCVMAAVAMATVATLLLVAAAVYIFITPRIQDHPDPHQVPDLHLTQDRPCSDQCRVSLVESIPEGLVFNSSSSHSSIFSSWMDLMASAQSSIDIASFYWTMTNEDTGTHEPTANQGEAVLQALAQLSGKLSVRIAVNTPQESQPKADLQLLRDSGADVRTVNMKKLTTGVLHTKFWIIDQKHLYIGSANMDWRSLTQVKELGVVVYDCGCLASDLGLVFEAYWFLGGGGSIPSPWPSSYSTAYNKDTPLQLSLNSTAASVYLTSSPPSLCAAGRTSDLDGILSVMEDAEEFIYIAVMNYIPTMEFSHPKRYWSAIDTALRRLSYEKRIRVRLLVSCWSNSQPAMIPFLRSLDQVQDPRTRLDIQVRLFVVPSNPRQKLIPFARVNHNKYLVTDRVAYVGTSNWSGDYFVNTAGSALVINQTESRDPTVQSQLSAVFQRDWDSAYSRPLSRTRDLCGPPDQV